MTNQTQKNGARTILRRFNERVLKLSWFYIIAISLVLMLLVQWYTSANQSSRIQKNNSFEQRIEALHERIIELEERVTRLENKE